MQFVFNLYPFNESLYLPAAWIVHTGRDGDLTYPAQRATPATCAPYDMEITPPIQQLLKLIDTLAPKAIEAHFKPPKAKTPTPLAEMLQIKHPAKSTVEGYIHRHLSTFLSVIVQHGFYLALEVAPKTIVKDILIHTRTEPLVPHLAFHKTDTGIEYRFQLGTETEKWPVSRHEVIALTNTDPAWLLVDYALFKVPGINGYMINPFRKKDLILIPPEQVKVYFKKFIARNAGRNHIEAEGFEVHSATRLLRVRLNPLEDILHQLWVLKPIFEYENAVFDWGEKRDNITTVEFEDATDSVMVKKVVRDIATEQQHIAKLQELGLAGDGRRFLPPNEVKGNAGLYWWIEWLSRHQKTLEKTGFAITLPEVEGKTIALLPGSIELRSAVNGDWFDVHGTVMAGDHQFAFKALTPYLREGNPCYPLPDGTYFLIPEEWFTRYADLAKALRDTPDGGKLPKALFTLLHETGDDTLTEDDNFPIIDPDTVDYAPDDDLKAQLRPYQLYGVKWLIGHYQHGFGACLADSMGLGKTLQTIAVLLYARKQQPEIPPPPPVMAAVTPALPGIQLDLFGPPAADSGIGPPASPATQPWSVPMRQPALVILPASLVFNWQQELARFAPSLFVRVHTGAQRDKDHRAIAMHDVVLTTYHTARQDLDLLSKITWDMIVLDESQQIKNRESEISKVVRSLESAHKISLSGTPIENSLADLWTQMEFINPSILGSYTSFREQFQLPIERQGDQQAKTQLFSRVRPFFLRRTKEEVAPDLPPLTHQVFYSEMSAAQRSRYEEIKSAVRNEILELFDDPKTRLLAIQALTRLRQLANHPILADAGYEGDSGKTEDILAQWETIRRDGHKVLFFSSFVQHLEIFKKIFEANGTGYAWLTGQVAQSERGAVIERFQNDPSVQVFLCSVKAGGVGLNLTAADYVFMLDPWWNPAAEDQAIARAHRIGQNKPVNAIRFISRDSIEEKIRLLQERKKALGEELFSAGAEMPVLNREDLMALLD